ncbi:MAG: hypothetical protein ACFFDH_02410 [Promethearchaeota archaeon]
MSLRESEIWNSVKEISYKNKINPFDTYVFVLDYIRKLEALLKRKLYIKEICEIIERTVLILSNKNSKF